MKFLKIAWFNSLWLATRLDPSLLGKMDVKRSPTLIAFLCILFLIFVNHVALIDTLMLNIGPIGDSWDSVSYESKTSFMKKSREVLLLKVNIMRTVRWICDFCEVTLLNFLIIY